MNLKPLNWIGALNEENGYGQATLGYLRGLLNAGVDVRMFNVGPKVQVPDNMKKEIEESGKLGVNKDADVCVFHCDGNQLIQFMKIIDENHMKKIKNISYMAWETDSCPSHWAAFINERLDKVMVPSESNKIAFIRGGVNKDKVEVVPHIITLPGDEVTKRDIKYKKEFVFLSIYDFVKKKGWTELLRAYWEEFKSVDDVCLIMKIYPSFAGGYTPEGVETIKATIMQYKQMLNVTDSAPVINLREFYDQPEMEGLWQTASAFVLPTRGEGFGLTFAEAAIRKVPIIATDSSGHRQFLPDNSFYSVKSEPWYMSDFEMGMRAPHYINQNMRICDVQSLRKQMRQCYEDWKSENDRLKNQVDLAYKSVVSECNEETIIKKLVQVLELDQPSKKEKMLLY